MPTSTTGTIIDQTSGKPVVISSEHHEIHDGNTYQEVMNSIDIQGSPLRIKLETADSNKRTHVFAIGTSSGISTFTITESPTGGAAGGSVQTVLNKRRDSVNLSLNTCTTGVTAPTGGLPITAELHGFDKDKIAGETRGTAEWILAPDAIYVFELTSSISDVVGNLLLIWYEQEE